MNSPNNLPELILGDGSPTDTSRLSRLQAQGQIRKIFRKIYTSNLESPLEEIVKRHVHQIAGHICPQGTLSHRTAFHGGLPREGVLVLTENSERTIKLPGLSIKIAKGPQASEGDPKHIGTLRISSFPRMLLENLQQTRNKGGIRKTVSLVELEEKLDRICSINGETELNRIRDEAKAVSKELEMPKEYRKLDALIGSLLGTHNSSALATPSGIARSKGKPYDTARIELFDTLCHELINADPQPVEDSIKQPDKTALLNRAFFESYFSNYIEGTKFVLSDAENIVFKQIPYAAKPKDSHDILATYQLASASAQSPNEPSPTSKAFLDELKQTHSTLMQARPEVEPGKFKLEMNQAGSTQFVDPLLVPGTLIQAYERSAQLANPLAKAIFFMFVVSEVHPFVDGNGRTARLAMNNELSRQQMCRIIIPTQRRIDYIQSLKAMSQGKPKALIGFLAKTQSDTSRINFESIASATAQYESVNAFNEYPEGFSIG